jgi:hypothetical protein
LLDLNVILEAKRRYDWVILFGDETNGGLIDE